MTMTNLKHVEHNPLSMSIEESNRKTRKGYQYVPDIPIQEAPLPPKRERKKVKYNDYVNPVKTLRKSPTRKRSPVRKHKKAHRPAKKQKLSETVEVFKMTETEEFLQSLNDKKRELEEKLNQINADLADVTHKLSGNSSDEDEEEEEEEEVEVENVQNESEVKKEIEEEKDVQMDDQKESTTKIKEENGDHKENSDQQLETSDQNDLASDSKENIEKPQENTENPIATSAKTTPKKTPKKPKRKRSTKKKKEPKEPKTDPKRVPTRVTRTSEALTAQEIQAANQVAFTKILNALIKHRYAFPFLEPVDPIALNIPDYLTIIKNPMDFGTVKAKLANNAYRSPKEFADDVNLVFTNACTYNQPGSDVYVMATTIQEIFIKKMNPTLTKQGFPLLAAPQLPNLSTLRSPNLYNQPIVTQPGYNELKRSVDQLRKDIVNLRSLDKPPVKVVKVEKETLIPMTRDEKRKLSNDINKLSSEHLGMVVKIIKQKMPIGDVDEIVIDIDSLDTSTLRDLEQYVLKMKKKKKGSRRGRANNARSQPVNNDQLKLEQAKKTEELTVQRLEDVQKRLNDLKNSNERNLLTNSTTIAFANPLEEPVEVKNDDQVDESESESASDTDSDASSSESGSENESGSESDSENLFVFFYLLIYFFGLLI